MRTLGQKVAAFRTHSRLVVAWAWKAWWNHPFRLLFPPVLIGAAFLVIGFIVHYQVNNRWPSFQLIAGQPVSEGIIYILYSMIPAVAVGLLAFGILCLVAPSQIQLEREDGDEDSRRRLLAEVVTAKADFEVKDRRSQEALSNQEMKFKGIIGDLEQRIGQLQSENAELRDDFDYRHALKLDLAVQGDYGAHYHKLEVRNSSSYRTLEDVRVKVLSISSAGPRRVKGRPNYFLPTLESLYKMPVQACETSVNLTASDAVLFVLVQTAKPPGEHELIRGECDDVRQPYHPDRPHWDRRTWPLFPGRYRVVVRADAKNVEPVSKTLEFWGDRTGVFCEEVDGNSDLQAAELTIEELYAQPPNPLEHEHHKKALAAEIRKPAYDALSVNEAYGVVRDNGIYGFRFLTESQINELPENQRLNIIPVTDEYASRFPEGIPYVPAIRHDEFLTMWNSLRGQSKPRN